MTLTSYPVRSREHKVEKCNDGTLELCSARPCDCVGTESLPDDAFANVGGNEEGNS